MKPWLLRIALVPISLLLISLVVFALMDLIPGDPILAMTGPQAAPEEVQEIREKWALDQPFATRYLTWLGNALQGDLGQSIRRERPVTVELAERLQVTLWLTAGSLAVALTIGLLFGIGGALYPGSPLDRCVSTLSLIGLAIPSFWLALLLVSLFSITLGWFPGSLSAPPLGEGGLTNSLRHAILPWISLGLVAGSVLARTLRTFMIEALQSDCLLFSKALGIPPWKRIWQDAFPLALLRWIPVIGLQISFLVGGAATIETVFQWQGLGSFLVQSIFARDYPAIQGVVIVVAAMILMANLCADALQSILDRRIQP